jgi:hypothetical protein
MPARDDRGRGTLFFDDDRDGFGVAAPNGPAAHDGNARTDSPASVKEKFGDPASPNGGFAGASIDKHLRSRFAMTAPGSAKSKLSIVYVSPDGDNSTARPDDASKPYADFDAARRWVGPGDVAVLRAGTYGGLNCDKLMGGLDKPITVMAAPGEKVVIAGGNQTVSIRNSSHLVLDGFAITPKPGGSGDGLAVYFGKDIMLRNLEISGFSIGIRGMQDLHDVTIERCVIHDNGPSHGIYLGSRDLPNSNITVRNCLIYRNGKHGLQHNGRVTNLRVEGNVIHSNGLAGVSLLEGVCKSVVRQNLIYNNSAQGIVFFLYDPTEHNGIAAFDEIDNVVENNTIWVGQFGPKGERTPGDHAALHFNDATAGQKCDMSAAIRNNIMVTFAGPALRLDQARFLDGCAFQGNQLWRTKGNGCLAAKCEGELLDIAQLQARDKSGKRISGNSEVQPAFKRARLDDWAKPELYDFGR